MSTQTPEPVEPERVDGDAVEEPDEPVTDPEVKEAESSTESGPDEV